MTPQEKTAIRDKRLMAALNLEKPDRIPIHMSGLGYFKFIDPTATLADYFRRPKYVDELLIKAAALPGLDEIDSPPMVGMTTEAGQQAFAAIYFATMKLPGRDLPDDTLWNIDEQGPMTEEDYDTVLSKGWRYMQAELYRRIGFDPTQLKPPDPQYMAELQTKVGALGKETQTRFALMPIPPFEMLSGARKLQKFFRDLRRMPDKVRAVLEIIEDTFVEDTVKMLQAQPTTPLYGFIGGSRSGSTFISPQTFEKFYFPYFRKVVPAMQKVGVRTWLHMDSDWSGSCTISASFPRGSASGIRIRRQGCRRSRKSLGI